VKVGVLIAVWKDIGQENVQMGTQHVEENLRIEVHRVLEMEIIMEIDENIQIIIITTETIEMKETENILEVIIMPPVEVEVGAQFEKVEIMEADPVECLPLLEEEVFLPIKTNLEQEIHHHMHVILFHLLEELAVLPEV